MLEGEELSLNYDTKDYFVPFSLTCPSDQETPSSGKKQTVLNGFENKIKMDKNI